ncbi:MAG TPA: porin [Aliidongia sp.]|uniref:OprO/OprP family phosphate-selective porin n=1 Tax=Aliidongia sp. TaxID=1914230 RepID=UPI002DDD3D7F|nr:porin [Aliidongia sp.]HEV2674706.1 porin [Aliidongia sp.]
MKIHTRLAGGVALSGLLAFAPAVQAQTAPTTAQLNALQQQIQLLQQQLQTLQSQVTQTQAQSQATAAAQAQTQAVAQKAAAAAPAADAPKVTETAAHRFGLSSADGRNTIQLTGRVQFDAGDYLNYQPGKGNAVRDLSSGVNARRARLGVVGKFDGDWAYGLIYDFGGSSDTLTNTNSGAPTSGLQNAYIQYNGFKGTTIEGGYLDLPITLDEATSSNDIMFLERAASVNIANLIAAGDFRSSFGAHWNDDRLWFGAYVSGPTSGAQHNIGSLGGSASQTGVAGRAAFQALQGADYSLHIGGDVESLLNPPHAGGFRSITFSDRPELRVDPTSILTSGAINNVSGATAYEAELAGGYRSLFLQGEYFHYQVDRDTQPGLDFDGAYAEASWTVTGEHRKYNAGTAAYGGIVPDHPLAFTEDGISGLGALELAARYSYVDLNDDFQSGKTTASTGGIAGGFQRVYTAGVNWYPNSNIRFMLDYLHGHISKAQATSGSLALGTPIGAKFDAIALRGQFAF